MNEKTKGKDINGLLAGIAATFIWGLGPAVTRTLSEDWGPFTASSTALLGGLLVLAHRARTTGLTSIRDTKASYWLLCGTSFLVFSLASHLAVGLVHTRDQVVSIGLLRLLWPLMTMVMTIPINKARTTRWFPVAVTVCFAGIVVANLNASDLSPLGILRNLSATGLPGLLALISSFAWGFYSNYFKRIIKRASDDYVCVLMMISGAIQFVCGRIWDPTPRFSTWQIGTGLFMVVVSSFLANVFWNAAMRSNQSLHVILVSNFLPVISTVLTGLLLGVPITPIVLAGSLLVVAGTVWSKKCFLPDET